LNAQREAGGSQILGINATWIPEQRSLRAIRNSPACVTYQHEFKYNKSPEATDSPYLAVSSASCAKELSGREFNVACVDSALSGAPNRRFILITLSSLVCLSGHGLAMVQYMLERSWTQA